MNYEIRSINQLCVKRLAENKFTFFFIYEMTNGSYTYQNYEWNFKQAKAYYAKKGWPETAIPWNDNQMIEIVHNGEFVEDYAQKYALRGGIEDESNDNII